MRTFDFSPLFRHSVGFDRLESLVDAATRLDDGNAYPPYNIEQVDDNGYRITMAVAGFGDADLDVTAKENTLFVTGKRQDDKEGAVYLHRGIAGRSFERRFQLAEHINVVGARLENGLLHVDLEREIPEEKKPRKIAIESRSGAKAITDKKAA